MSDQSIQANHPVSLDPALLAKVLQGLEVQEKESFGIQKMVAGPSGSAPVFSDDQIRFLAPLLAEGLRRATPDESVQFLVRSTHDGSLFESSSVETTSGSLYAYGRQLYVTISQYRSSVARTNQNLGRGTSRPSPPDFTGLRDRILFFTPKIAQRSDSFDPPARVKPTDRFVAVDYELLQQAPTATQTAPQVERAAPMPSAQVETKAPEATSPSTEALAQEVETLRKELKSVQERLGSQPTKPDSLKQKPALQKK